MTFRKRNNSNHNRTTFHYAWVVLTGSSLMMFYGYGICYNLMSVFLAALESHLELTKTETSAIMSIIMVGSACATLSSAVVYKKLSTRTAAFLFMLFMAGGFAILSTAKSTSTCYLAASLIGIGFGGGSLVPVSLLINLWFKKKKGVALGIASASSGIATVLLPIVIGQSILRAGVSMTLLLTSLMILFLGITVVVIVREKPADKDCQPYGAVPESTSSEEEKKQPNQEKERKTGLKEIISSQSFLKVSSALFLVSMAAGPTVSLLPSFLQSAGYTLQYGTYVMTVYGFAIMFGKILYGTIIDTLGSSKSNLYGYSMIAGALICGCLIGVISPIPFVLAITLGLGMPLITVTPPVWVGDFFDQEVYTEAFSLVCFFSSLGAGLGLVVSGWLTDITGSFKVAYIVALVLTVVSLIVIQRAYAKLIKKNEMG